MRPPARCSILISLECLAAVWLPNLMPRAKADPALRLSVILGSLVPAGSCSRPDCPLSVDHPDH